MTATAGCKSVAKLLMDDYGVPRKHYRAVLYRVVRLRSAGVIHVLIVAGVRGWTDVPHTRDLRHFLNCRRTHPPLNHQLTPTR